MHFLKKARSRLSRFHPRRWLRRLAAPLRQFGERYSLEDNTEVVVYTAHPDTFPHYPRVAPLHLPRQAMVKVSLVATARNERQNVDSLFASLMQQTRLPDEVIFIDTGSVDGTAERLRELAASSPIPVQVLVEPGANIARGRNTAIAAACHPVIAVTDFGCQPLQTWLGDLVAPFEIEPALEVSAGRYEAVDSQGKPSRWLLGRTLDQIDPQSHLPSAVSIAFRKTAWEQVGGYPEWLTLTGEDTYFAMELKRTTRRWAFVPEAVVRWEAPQRLLQRWRKAYFWSIGDGEAGMTARAYRWAALKIGTLLAALGLSGLILLLAVLSGETLVIAGAAVLGLAGAALFFRRLGRRGESLPGFLTLTGTYLAELLGFSRGYTRRSEVDRRRFAGLKGAFFILAGVPVDDTGGGARWTQIALELVRRQYLVVFIHKFPKYESVELGLNIRHPNLLTFTSQAFDWQAFNRRYPGLIPGKSLAALVELPLADFLPLIEYIRAAGGTVIYDLLDDWDTALGGQWYHPDTERQVISASHILTATAPSLANRLEELSGRPVHLLPNAVNSLLFNPARSYPQPADLPQYGWVVLYVGALWGEWFDWDLLVRVAETYPEAAVVVIGDYAGQCPRTPSNLRFLGLKAQKEIPAYLAAACVTIVPWKVSAITQATSPLKVYEYLAMGKPVVAPAIQPLQGLPGVFLCRDADEFVDQVGVVRHAPLPLEDMERFIAGNNWQARVDALLALAAGQEAEER